MKKPLSNKLEKVSPSMTLAITSKANAMKAEGIKVFSFGAGEPDFDTPAVVIEAGKEAMDKGITRYTDVKGLIGLRQAIADKYKKEFNLEYDAATEIITSSGAKHSLFTALQTLLSDGDEVIIPVPYWVSYSEMVKIAGGVPVFVYPKKENSFVMTGEELEAAITDKTKVVMLNNPSNPTGVVYTKEQLQEIADVCVKHGIYILSDDIYEMLLYNGKKFTPIASLGDDVKDLTIIVNGASKAYAMTGWRVGYVLANKDIVKGMSTIQGQCVSHPSSISQYATMKALQADQQMVYDMVEKYDERRKYMLDRFGKMDGVEPIEPDGAFYVFLDVSSFYGKKYDGKEINGSIEFAAALLESKKVACIPGIGFGADDFVRFSYATSMEVISAGLDLFEEFIGELK